MRTIFLVSILFGLSIFASPGLVAAQNLRSVAVAAADIVYSPLTGHIYAPVPTANAIVTIDPVAGATAETFDRAARFIGDAHAVAVDAQAIELEAGGLSVQCVETPDVIAVTLMFTSISPGHDAVVIFDHGVARATNINTPSS